MLKTIQVVLIVLAILAFCFANSYPFIAGIIGLLLLAIAYGLDWARETLEYEKRLENEIYERDCGE